MLLISPPRLGEPTDRSELWGFGEARLKAEALPRLFRNVAAPKGVPFLDAAALIAADPADGVHLARRPTPCSGMQSRDGGPAAARRPEDVDSPGQRGGRMVARRAG